MYIKYTFVDSFLLRLIAILLQIQNTDFTLHKQLELNNLREVNFSILYRSIVYFEQHWISYYMKYCRVELLYKDKLITFLLCSAKLGHIMIDKRLKHQKVCITKEDIMKFCP